MKVISNLRARINATDVEFALLIGIAYFVISLAHELYRLHKWEVNKWNFDKYLIQFVYDRAFTAIMMIIAICLGCIKAAKPTRPIVGREGAEQE